MTDYEMNTKTKMIEDTFSYDSYEVTRLEVFAHTRAAQMTIRPEGISFNQACINSFEDTTHIQILVSQDQKRIAIRRSEEGDKDAIRWCTAKNKAKLITGRKFSEMVYELMGWDAGAGTRQSVTRSAIRERSCLSLSSPRRRCISSLRSGRRKRRSRWKRP